MDLFISRGSCHQPNTSPVLQQWGQRPQQSLSLSFSRCLHEPFAKEL